MEKVLFIGGAKGTGKSTLCKMLSDETGMKVVNTGDFFSLYHAPKKEVKQYIISSIIKEAPTIVDTHYAGFAGDTLNGNFERALFIDELESLSKGVDLHLVLVDLDIETLITRRLGDKLNRRDISVSYTIKELELNRKFFFEYCQQLGEKGYTLINHQLDKSLQELLTIYKEVFG